MSKRSLLLAFVVLALVGAGCSSKSSTNNNAGGSPTPSTCTPAATTTVSVLDSRFEAKDLCVKTGTTVTWDFQGALPHTVTADDGAFDSKQQAKGFKFTQTFSTAGTVPYYCTIHGAKGGGGMSGTITVVAA